MFYKEVRRLGAIYAELQPKGDKPFFEVDREDGEIFVWIGRLYLILTPWKRLRFTGMQSTQVPVEVITECPEQQGSLEVFDYEGRASSSTSQ